jgi:predicted nucleotidyltransferase
MDLKFELEDRLGATVDLVLTDAIKDRLRDSILSEAVYV